MGSNQMMSKKKKNKNNKFEKKKDLWICNHQWWLEPKHQNFQSWSSAWKLKNWAKMQRKPWKERSRNYNKKYKKNPKLWSRLNQSPNQKNKKRTNKFVLIFSQKRSILSWSLIRLNHLRRVSRSRLLIWEMHAGRTIILQLKFKQGNIEDQKLFWVRSIISLLICGRWLVWLLRCWLVICCSIPRETLTKFMGRMMIILLRWWSYWAYSPKSFQGDAPNSKNTSQTIVSLKEYPICSNGQSKILWSPSIISSYI